jgi:formylglycine-generating enzyme required for sulfatase activity
MVRITAGSFSMGTDGPDDSQPDEKPVHRVTLPAFQLDRTEVTVGAYAACVAAAACIPFTTVQDSVYSEGQNKWASQFCNWGKARREQHPINCVPWDEAKKFCVWANKRLPTEEEWEYAARGSEGRTYPWGEAFPGPSFLNACGEECSDKFSGWTRMYSGNDGWWHTAPVGSFPAGTQPLWGAGSRGQCLGMDRQRILTKIRSTPKHGPAGGTRRRLGTVAGPRSPAGRTAAGTRPTTARASSGFVAPGPRF